MPVKKLIFLLLIISFTPLKALAVFDWMVNEIQYTYGELDVPSFAEGNSESTHILTLQHADAWQFGDNFFFIDYLDSENNNDFNDSDIYTEWYFNFSLGKITKSDVGLGPIKDIGLLFGINYAKDSKVYKYLPGIRLSWDIEGFVFLNSDFTAYIDDSRGVNSGGAPKEDNSYMVDINWAYPFNIGKHLFSIEGHVEYIGERDNEFDQKVESWVLAQPQFRYDLGNTLFDKKEKFYIGIEWQYWNNKLGDKQTNENAIQALLVWRL